MSAVLNVARVYLQSAKNDLVLKQRSGNEMCQVRVYFHRMKDLNTGNRFSNEFMVVAFWPGQNPFFVCEQQMRRIGKWSDDVVMGFRAWKDRND